MRVTQVREPSSYPSSYRSRRRRVRSVVIPTTHDRRSIVTDNSVSSRFAIQHYRFFFFLISPSLLTPSCVRLGTPRERSVDWTLPYVKRRRAPGVAPIDGQGNRRCVRSGAGAGVHARARSPLSFRRRSAAFACSPAPPDRRPARRSPASPSSAVHVRVVPIPIPRIPISRKAFAGRFLPANREFRSDVTYVDDARRRAATGGGRIRPLPRRWWDGHDVNALSKWGDGSRYPGYITHRLPFATYGVAVYRSSTSAPRRRASSLSPPVDDVNASPTHAFHRAPAPGIARNLSLLSFPSLVAFFPSLIAARLPSCLPTSQSRRAATPPKSPGIDAEIDPLGTDRRTSRVSMNGRDMPRNAKPKCQKIIVSYHFTIAK